MSQEQRQPHRDLHQVVRTALWALLGIAAAALACVRGPADGKSNGHAEVGATAGSGVPLLLERSEQRGLAFAHVSGATGELYAFEPIGAGGAQADFDGDGDLDVFLVQGAWLGLDDVASWSSSFQCP